MDFIKQVYSKDTILLMYKCGSYAFGTSNDKSDEDYVVVLKDFKGMTHLTNGKKEYFIFGLQAWKDKQDFSDNYDEYYEIFNDEILAFPSSIIYMDDSMNSLIEHYRNSFESNYKKWIKKVIEYFRFYYRLGDLNKNMYHLIRIRHIVENYLDTGSFSLELPKEVLNKILDYKSSTNREVYRSEINQALVYLSNIGEVTK